MRRAALCTFWILTATVGCGADKRALAIARCDASVLAYVTHTESNWLGKDHFAIVRVEVPRTAVESARRACVLAQGAYLTVEYPEYPLPKAMPDWWDLHDGEHVEFHGETKDQGAWVGFGYRKATDSGELWLLYATTH